MQWIDNILAQQDGEGSWVGLVVTFLVIGVLSLLNWLGQQSKKNKQDEQKEQEWIREMARRRQQQAQGGSSTPSPARRSGQAQPGSVEEIVQAMRDAARQRSGQEGRQPTAPRPTPQQPDRQPAAPPPPLRTAPAQKRRPLPAEPRRTPPPQPKPTPAPLSSIGQRRLELHATGQEIQEEISTLDQGVVAPLIGAMTGVGGIGGSLGSLGASAPAEDVQSRSPGLKISLSAAGKGILLREILGPPVALRKEPQMWEL